MYRMSPSARDELAKIHKRLEVIIQSSIRQGNITEADRLLRLLETRLSEMLDEVEIVSDGE